MGSDVLGGTKIWVKGESGTYYYYAHLSAFAEGMHDGKLVEPGEVIGFVGDTGNARGGPPHLHFQIHPDGGAPVNPSPLLKVVDELARAAKARMDGRRHEPLVGARNVRWPATRPPRQQDRQRGMKGRGV